MVYIALSPQAHAGPKEEADAYATLARAAFESGDYATCARHFRASYDLVANPAQLFNVGLCHEKGDDLVKALAAFREYVQVAPGGDRAAEARTRAELIALKLEAQAKPVESTPTEAVPDEAETVEASSTTSASESAGPASAAADDASATQPARAYVPPPYVPPYVAKSSKVYSIDERIFLQMPLGLVWLDDGEEGGPGVSLGWAAHLFRESGGTGLVLRIRGAYGNMRDHFVNVSFGPGLVLGNPDLNFFAGPAIGLIFYDPTNESSMGFDLHGVAGINKRLAGKFDVEITYTRHLLDSINAFSVGFGVRFGPK